MRFRVLTVNSDNNNHTTRRIHIMAPTLLLFHAGCFSAHETITAPTPTVRRPLTPETASIGPLDLRGKTLRDGYIGYLLLHRGGFGSMSSIVIEEDIDGAHIYTNTASGSTHEMVSSTQWNELHEHVEKANFWSMHNNEEHGPRARDADTWTLVGLRNGTRHQVGRMIPFENSTERSLDEFVRLCQFMLDTAHVRCNNRDCFHTRKIP